jgi:hypothetical protein
MRKGGVGRNYYGTPSSSAGVIARIRKANYGREAGSARLGQIGEIFTVSHHHGYEGLYAIAGELDALRVESESAGCPFVVGTVMREPLAQVISAYFYNDHNIKNWKWELHNNTNFDNPQTRYILNNHHKLDPAYEGIEKHESVDKAAMCTAAAVLTASVDEIGFTTDLSWFMKRFSARMGFPSWKPAVKNRHKHSAPPPEMMACLQTGLFWDRKLKIDSLLYEGALKQHAVGRVRGERQTNPACVVGSN